MSVQKTPKNHLISQLFWQMEIGADEAITENPMNFDTILGVREYLALIPKQDNKNLESDHKKQKGNSEPATLAEPQNIALSHLPHPGKNISSQESSQLLQAVNSLDELKKALQEFEGCSLKNTASQLVFSDGNPNAKIMIIGEAPGRDEDRMGIPFVGQTGRLLDKMLKSIGIDRQQIYITNFIPWRPPGNRTPTQEEISLLMPFVQKHIQLISPEIIVALGGVSAKALLDTQISILKLRGKFENKDFGLKSPTSIFSTLHPSYLFRAPAQKKLAFADLVTLKREMMVRSL